MIKKITIGIILVIVIGAGWMYIRRSSPETPNTSQPVVADSSKPDPSNATFTFDEGAITLSSGVSEISIPDSVLIEEVDLMDKFAYGDINGDGKNDTALLLARYGGGSGTFIYAAVFASGPVGYRGSQAFYLGDRIAPQSLSISGNILTVNYLDRKPDQAFSEEPTVPVSKQFTFQNGELREK